MVQILSSIFLIALVFYLFYQAALQLGKLGRKRIRPHKDVKLFSGNFIDARAFYLKEFKSLPCINSICHIDSNKLMELIKAEKFGRVLAIYQRKYYSWHNERLQSERLLFKLTGKLVVELGDEYAEILYDSQNQEVADRVFDSIADLVAPAKEVENEINIITLDRDGLDLKTLPIKPTTLDTDLFYNDDFKPVDKLIKERLANENDKGIVLLHGLPGTGKTTYLRHLVGSINKRVLFVSPSVAGNLMNPEFIDLLIDNPNSVLVVEDAENIIMDRKFSNNSSVSNLLNLSDGLMSDCLNVQIICTFNSSLTMVDSALMRKGRLIAKYEFGKLEISKAQLLSDHLGLSQKIDKPITLAELTNPGEPVYQPEPVSVIGFRRTEPVQN